MSIQVSDLLSNVKRLDTRKPEHLVLAEKTVISFDLRRFSMHDSHETRAILTSGILPILQRRKFSPKKCALSRGNLMIRVVIIVLVAAGFFITGDIPSVITGLKTGLVAVQGHAQNVFSPADWKMSLDFGEKEQRQRLNKDVSAEVTESVTPSWERLPSEATRSIDAKDLVAGSRLVLWLVRKNSVSATQVDVIDPETGEVLLTPTDSPARSPKRGRIDMNALREGGEVSVNYNHRSHFSNSATLTHNETLGAVLGIEHSRSNQE
ncbi:MAG: hypothetical protein ABGW79_01405 [Pirellulales bacterium]